MSPAHVDAPNYLATTAEPTWLPGWSDSGHSCIYVCAKEAEEKKGKEGGSTCGHRGLRFRRGPRTDVEA